MPVEIDVCTVAAAGRPPLDDYLAGPGGTGGASLLAVPIRRQQVRVATEPGASGVPGDGDRGGWPAVTGVDTAALASATGLSAAEAISAYDLSGKAGEVARVAARTPGGVVRLILLGVGDGSPADFRRAGAALARQVERGQKAVAALPSDATDAGTDAFTEGLLLGGYKFSMRAGTARPAPSGGPTQSGGPGGSPDGDGRAVHLLGPAGTAPKTGSRAGPP